jgi:L,D-transpeptidase ErfK/SrfK
MRFRVLTFAAVAGLLAPGAAAPRAGDPVAEAYALSGGVGLYTVARGDSLTSIGARLGVSRTIIARANGIGDRDRLQAGRTLVIDNRHIIPPRLAGEALVVNVPQRMLFVYTDEAAAAFPVAVGRADWPTPRGPFVIVEKERNPAWDLPESIRQELRQRGQPAPERVPPGPSNPLGSHWMRTSFPAIGIHGTPETLTLYRAVTHGCIRVHPADVASVYALVPAGAAGRLVYEPVLLAVTPDGVFLEAHPDVYRLAHVDAAALRKWAGARGIERDIDWAAASDVLGRRDGIARRIGERHHE